MHNKSTGQVRDEEMCGSEALPKYFHDYGVEIKLAAETVQEDRNAQANALKVIEDAANVMGSDQFVKSLAEFGMRAAVGHMVNKQLTNGVAESE